jgi:hypothetical protein
MGFIDWSDSEGMFELLVEFVRNAQNESKRDPGRKRFLSQLVCDLKKLDQKFDDLTTEDAITQLQTIYDSIDSEFVEDPVTVHIKDCIDELEKVSKRT